jgi:hypothetical protein
MVAISAGPAAMPVSRPQERIEKLEILVYPAGRSGGLPPRHLIAVPVNGPMVGASERNGEFIADPAPRGSRLHEPQMVSVGRLPSAQKARLRPPLSSGPVRFDPGPVDQNDDLCAQIERHSAVIASAWDLRDGRCSAIASFFGQDVVDHIEHAHTELAGHWPEPWRCLQSGPRIGKPLLPAQLHRGMAELEIL